LQDTVGTVRTAGGKKNVAISAAQKLKGIAYLVNAMLHYRGITRVSTGYDQQTLFRNKGNNRIRTFGRQIIGRI
jgi:hypothetical protein